MDTALQESPSQAELSALPMREKPIFTGGMDVDESNRYLAIDAHPTLEDVYVLQELLQHADNQYQFLVKHYWADGVYTREMLIPKDCCLVGVTHAHDQMTFVMKGDISVMSEEGMIRIKAPFIMRSKAGLKRAGYAHEDTIFVTCHANPDNCKDVAELEDRLTADIDKSFKTLERTS